MTLFETDWEKELRDDERAVRKDSKGEIEVVFLAGLQRLARQAGIVNQGCVIQNTTSGNTVQAIFSTTFLLTKDCREVTFVGTADCNKSNTSGVFLDYPTAVAESRAEARCLRKALGIRALSSEEVGLREGVSSLEAAPDRKVDTQLVQVIEKLCTGRDIEIITMLEAVLDKDRASSVMELTELTLEEAQSAMSWLNTQKPKKKVKK